MTYYFCWPIVYLFPLLLSVYVLNEKVVCFVWMLNPVPDVSVFCSTHFFHFTVLQTGTQMERSIWWYHIESIAPAWGLTWLVPRGNIPIYFSWEKAWLMLEPCIVTSFQTGYQAFTMDEQRSKAVTEAFVRLHKEGLIYRLVSPHFQVLNWKFFHYQFCLIVDLRFLFFSCQPSFEWFIPFQRLSPCELGLHTSNCNFGHRGWGNFYTFYDMIDIVIICMHN